LAVVYFGLTLCRAAARSDDSRAVAVTEWFATMAVAERDAAFPAEAATKQARFDSRRGRYRAAG
jgi:hypothetical protein